ncbi:MAG: hypothetical protein WED09_10440 [Homoserinimonas sp.]
MDTELVWVAALYAVLLPLLGAIVGLLVLYGIIRVGVSRGLRDHYRWLELNRASAIWQNSEPLDQSDYGRTGRR